ncbi:DUF6612 family protein [Salinibacillus xinjiangensis]|uniref:LppX_LprAFG lipoprotein n=1 Tax=Salinibacillus xinjiangensis TaxID=1229268 RepID=A0A6G1X2U4_9BACI|nr:DUF6612 family protein [Salinibacillus xinjiangensis]MRG85216.1 hypothetical protein [Salinibacillus xinjiangensis]
MKKAIVGLGLLVFMTLFVACGNGTDNPQDVYEQAMEASSELENFEMEMEMNQEIGIAQMDQPLTMNMKSSGKVQVEPQAIYQEMTLQGLMAGKQEVEMYYTDEGLYMKEGDQNWKKASEEMLKQLNQFSQSQSSPREQLKQLEDYVDDMSMAEKEDHYEITITSSGDNLKKLIVEQISQNNISGNEINEEMLENVNIKNVNIEFHVEKDTFYPLVYNLDMEIEEQQNEETSNVKVSIHSTYSNFNEVGEITVPDEVKKSAE